MKIQSMQFKVLATIISAMLAITIFIGGLSIYEVDHFVQAETENFINVTCEKDASQINDVFGDMEKSVHIMESYVCGLIQSESDIRDAQRQVEILEQSNDMFVDVAKNTDDAVSYYLRFSPELSNSPMCGFFYSKVQGKGDFLRFEITDLLRYDKDDTEHVGWYWQPYEAGKPIWMMPYYNQNNSTYMISYVVPLYYNDKFFGVVGMDFDYTILTDKVHKMKIYKNGFAHLEYDGNVIHDEQHGRETKAHATREEYLRVSKELKNGMTLVLSASYHDIRQIRYDIALKILFVVLLLAVLFSLIAVFTVRRIVQPLNTLTAAAVKLSNGDYDVDIKHSNTYEIELLSTAFEKMTRNLKEHEQLQHLLAYRDSLTGLRNMNSYKAWVGDFEKEIENKKSDFGIIVLDINYLKETNDQYGHDAGNKLIVLAAQLISCIFKRSPVFRIGGDEFVVILQNRDLADVDSLIRKLDAECVGVSVETGDASVQVSIAKGFAKYNPNQDTKFLDVFNRADDAMYENKRKMKTL